MSRPEGLLEVGRIGRPHGIRGDLFLDLITDHTERAQVGSRLWARDRWLTISQSSPSNKRWRVHLEGVDERNAAEALTGLVVFAEPIDDPDALWIHELIGANVLEVNGIDRGRVSRSSPTRPPTCSSSNRVRWCRSASSPRSNTPRPAP